MKFAVILVLWSALGSSAWAQDMPDSVKKVLGKYSCVSCHSMTYRMVGPSWKELAKQGYTAKKLGNLLRNPQPANWPDYPPMEPVRNITQAEIKVLADWLHTLNH